MLWHAMSGMRFRMPEGYFVGADAAGRAQFGPSPTPLSRAIEAIQAGRPPPPTRAVHAVLDRVLRGWRVQTVLVGPMGHQSAMVGFFTTLLGRPPTRVGGVLAWWNVGQTDSAGLSRPAHRTACSVATFFPGSAEGRRAECGIASR
jgi:hypothetical protein